MHTNISAPGSILSASKPPRSRHSVYSWCVPLIAVHGDPGRRRVKLMPAAEIAAELVNAITADLGERVGGEIILRVSFGGTPLSELYLMYDAVRKRLEAAGSVVVRSLVGNYVTSLDISGLALGRVGLSGGRDRERRALPL
jgi:dihydroxyacetone kinase